MTRHLFLMYCIYVLYATSGGVQYLLVFPSLTHYNVWEFQVMISTMAAEAKIQVLGSNMSQHFRIQRDQPFRLYLDRKQLCISEFFTVEEKAVLVKSDTPIQVQGHLESVGSVGGYTAFPIEAGNNRFIVTAYTGYNSDIIVAAVSDKTNVEVSFANGSSIVINLPAYGTYSIRSGTDLTGTLVAANGQIAVYSGHMCANVPVNAPYCDRLIEGIPPLFYQGKNYIIPSIGGRSIDTRYIVRVLSVGLQGSLSTSGNFYTNAHKEINFHSNIPRALHCAVGCFVYLYNKGHDADASFSDPFMMRVIPVIQYANKLTWITPIRSNVSSGNQFHHYVSIIAPTEETSGVLLDGISVNQSLWSVVESSMFSFISLSTTDGLHTVYHTKSNVNMTAYAYGHGQIHTVGYGFPVSALDAANKEKPRVPALSQTAALYKTITLGMAVTTGLLLLMLIATWITCFIKIRKRHKPWSSPPPRPPRIHQEDVDTLGDRVYYTHLSGAGHSDPHAYQSMKR